MKRREFKLIKGAQSGTGSSSSSSSCCCCESVDYADTVYSDGITAVERRRPCDNFAVITQEQQHGILTVTIPAKELVNIDKGSSTDTHSYTIPSSAFSAVYNSGNDATSDLPDPEGTIEFKHKTTSLSGCTACDVMQLRIFWTQADLTIPEELDDEPL